MFEKIFARQVRWQAVDIADTQIDGRFTEIQRHQLGVAICKVQQGNLANWIKFQKLFLGQFCRGRAQASGSGGQDGGCGGNLHEISAGQHDVFSG